MRLGTVEQAPALFRRRSDAGAAIWYGAPAFGVSASTSAAWRGGGSAAAGGGGISAGRGDGRSSRAARARGRSRRRRDPGRPSGRRLGGTGRSASRLASAARARASADFSPWATLVPDLMSFAAAGAGGTDVGGRAALDADWAAAASVIGRAAGRCSSTPRRGEAGWTGWPLGASTAAGAAELT